MSIFIESRNVTRRKPLDAIKSVSLREIESRLFQRLKESGVASPGFLDSFKPLGASLDDPFHIQFLRHKPELEQVILGHLAEILECDYLGLNSFNPDPDLTRLVPQISVLTHHFQVLSKIGDEVLVACANPFQPEIPEILATAIPGVKFIFVLSTPTEIDAFSEKARIPYSAAEELMAGLEQAVREDEIEAVAENDESPIARLVNLFISRGIDEKARKILIEPFENELRISFLTDAGKILCMSPLRQAGPAIIQRLKILTSWRVNLPSREQTGLAVIRHGIAGISSDFHIQFSVLQTAYGESGEIKIIDPARERASARIPLLGMPPAMETEFRSTIRRRSGLVLIIGPAHSGKTTSQYAALQDLAAESTSLFSLEDPIEFPLPHVHQIDCEFPLRRSPVELLPSLVRKAPATIVIGEIRNRETLQMVLDACDSGCLVVGGITATGFQAALQRFQRWGVTPAAVISPLLLAQSQRLLRGVCPDCATEVPPSDRQLADLGVDESFLQGISWKTTNPQELLGKTGVGCKTCRNSGYQGWHGVFEQIFPDAPLSANLEKGASPARLYESLVSGSPGSLRCQAILQALAGRTSFDEILRM